MYNGEFNGGFVNVNASEDQEMRKEIILQASVL